MKHLHIILAFIIFNVSCSNPSDETTILTWKDPNTQTQFKITKEVTLTKHISTLHVAERSIQIDDDVSFTNPRLIKFQKWLFICNDNNIWGAYNYDTKQLFGEHDWDKLPFTVYIEGGELVAGQSTLTSVSSSNPVNWPKVLQSN